MESLNGSNFCGNFFPMICESTVATEMVNSINRYVDDLLLDDLEGKKWKSYNLLCRDIQNIFLKTKDSISIGFTKLAESLGDEYLSSNNVQKKSKLLFAPELEKEIYVDAWINRYYFSDYTPAHTHNNCQISGIIFLKLSNKLISPLDTRQDGKLQFIIPGRQVILYEPEQQVGKVILFPSQLIHLVYPQKNDVERRTLSFNLVIG